MPNNTLSGQPTTSSTGPAVAPELSGPTVRVDSDALLPPVELKDLTTHEVLEQAGATSSQTAEDAVRRWAAAVTVRRGVSDATVIGYPTSSLHTRQFWEGSVTDVRNGEFTAIVQDRTNPDNPDEQVVFGFDEISDTDRSLVKPGAPFYWVIGLERTPAGQQKNISLIRFRRTPPLSRSALVRAKSRANEFLSFTATDKR